MSRYIKETNDKLFIYGFDHTVGYFYDLYDISSGDLIETGSSLFGVNDKKGTFTNYTMAKNMEKYSVDKNHITAVLLDLPF